MNREEDKIKLKNLRHGEGTTVHWFDGGGGLVYKIEYMFILFEVPQFGGMPMYAKTYYETQTEDLLDMAYSWT